MLKGKTIIVGVTGGIAAYKACEVVSRLKKLNADVWVVMTREAAQLVGPLTFRTLSGNSVISDLFANELSSLPVPHITLAKKADLILIAPCTANVIGKIAHGIADDALTTTVMASTAKKIIAPAMNCEMWRNPIVTKNVDELRVAGCEFIGPVEGRLACGDDDVGRMAEPGEIVAQVLSSTVAQQDLKDKRILVTAGGTREAIDPVRYITNHSSGKMGYALAQVARERGADVTLISAPTNLSAPLDIKPIRVQSAEEMLEAVLAHYDQTDVVIMAAAVADYRPKMKDQKSKIKGKVDINLKLKPTKDILKTVAKQKDRVEKVLVGFALETEDLIKNAKKKLKEKDLDLIVANGPETFDGDKIKFSLIDKKGKVKKFPQQTKNQAAQTILDRLVATM